MRDIAEKEFIAWCQVCGRVCTEVESHVPELVNNAKCLMRDRPNDAGIQFWLDECVSMEEERKRYG
jgi:hypothetical protein